MHSNLQGLGQEKRSHFLVQLLEMCTAIDLDLSSMILELDDSFVQLLLKKIDFSDEKYTRTCIYNNGTIEAVILAWMPGQQTVIHNHAGHSCYWKMLSGTVTEHTFELNRKKQNLDFQGSTTFKKGETGYDKNEDFYHQIINESDEVALSLHIYKNPLEYCQMYDVETEKFENILAVNDFEDFDILELSER